MSKPAALAPGLKFEQSLRITAAMTVPQVGRDLAHFGDMPGVLATAYLVALVEDTCIGAIKPHLAAGQHSVGTHIDLSHVAATPPGMTVTVAVELVAVEGRKLTFQVDCRDGREPIGGGRHQRMLIDLARFEARVAGKAANLPPPAA